MKKILVILMALIMLTACSSKKEESTSDLDYIKQKGTLIVGITEFEPMDYLDNGEWVGFDADLAKEFAKSIGVEAEFVVIDWDNKILELNSKSIDCVWNGMTITDEVLNAMEASNPYADNAQVVVMKKDLINEYPDIESIKDLTFAVEAGSAGEAEIDALGYNKTAVTAQSDTLLEVKANTSDAAVIDLLMASAMTGEGTNYEDLAFSIRLNSEEYGVGFRKGSNMASTLNDFLKSAYNDGTLDRIGETYNIKDAIIVQ